MKLCGGCGGRFGCVSRDTSASPLLTSALMLLLLTVLWVPTVRSGAIGGREYHHHGGITIEHYDDEDRHDRRKWRSDEISIVDHAISPSGGGGTGATDHDGGLASTTEPPRPPSSSSVYFEPYIFSNNMTLQRTVLVPTSDDGGDGRPPDDSKRSKHKPTVLWGGGAPPSTDLTLTVSTRGSWNLSSAPDGSWEFAVPPGALVEVASNLTITISVARSIPTPVTEGSIRRDEGRKDEATLRNVAVGDVYLCSGQSNMVFTANVACPTDPRRCEEEMENTANYPDVRMMTVQRTSSDDPMPSLTNGTVGPAGWTGGWYPGGPDSFDEVPGGEGGHGHGRAFTYFSAACYFFGRDLYDALDGTVPIGLISSSYGGTRVELWMTPEAIEECEDRTAEKLKTTDREGESEVDGRLDAVGGSNHPLIRAGNSSPRKVAADELKWNALADRPFVDFVDEGSSVVGESLMSMGQSSLWNAMINPLLRFNLRGFVWYQGEANAADPGPYGCLFASMIRDWRRKFFPSLPAEDLGPSNAEPDDGDELGTSPAPPAPPVPFLFVQLAPFDMKRPVEHRRHWEGIRYEQSAGGLSEPNTGMAVSLDLGDASSPFNDVHPRRKKEVGRRLSLLARRMIYDDDVRVGGSGDRPLGESTNTPAATLTTGPVLTGYSVSEPDRDTNTTLVVLRFDPATTGGLHVAGSADCDVVGGDGPKCCDASPFLVTTDDLIGPADQESSTAAAVPRSGPMVGMGWTEAFPRAGEHHHRLDPNLLLRARWTPLPSDAHEVRPDDSSVAVTVPLRSGTCGGVDGNDDEHGAVVTGLALHWETVPPCVLYNGSGGPDDGAALPAAPFAIDVTWRGRRVDDYS